LEKKNFSEFKENFKNNFSEDEGILEIKQNLNLSLQEEVLYEEKAEKTISRYSKRNNDKKNLKEESNFSNEGNKSILNCNTKVEKQEKENLNIKNNFYNYEEFVKKIDNGTVSIEKVGFSNTKQIIKKTNETDKQIKSALEIDENKNSKKIFSNKVKNENSNSEKKSSAFVLGKFNYEKKVNDISNNIINNLFGSKVFSFSEVKTENLTLLSIKNDCNYAGNELNKSNSNETKSNHQSLNINNLNSNSDINSSDLFGISSLKNKLSLKVVIPVLDKKMLNDNNTETLSVKDNKENLLIMTNLRENVRI